MKKPKRAAAILAAAVPRPAQTSPGNTEIRALRTASNHAIATGNLVPIAATLAEDFLVIIGDGTLLSREAYLEAFAHTFQQPVPLRYERIADSVNISTSASLAAEHGHWIGSLPNGQVLFTGTYMAMWRRTEAGWKLRSELFVSLTEVQPRYRPTKVVPA